MIITFSIENYRSIRDRITLDFRAVERNKEHWDDNVFQAEYRAGKKTKTYNLIKTIAIYGANASGKSNVLRALGFFSKFIVSSTSIELDDEIDVDPFLLDELSSTRDSIFEIEFLLDQEQYRYKIALNQKEVTFEGLYLLTSTKESTLFERKNQRISVGDRFPEGINITDKVRENVLFLSVVAKFNGPNSKKITRYFNKTVNTISGLQEGGYLHSLKIFFKNRNHQKEMMKLLKIADLGIDKVIVKETEINEKGIPKNLPKDIKELLLSEGGTVLEVKSSHNVLDLKGNRIATIDFDFDHFESEGTKKLFYLSGPILDTLKFGKTLIIDEFDVKLHPNLIRALVLLFNTKETNPKGAQLMFVTHDANLLDSKLFRRDQIWFTEKNKQQSTVLYSLAEFKTDTIRKNESIQEKYLQGRFGAVPYIDNIITTFEATND